MPAAKGNGYNVFLDSSVLVAATFSSSGGSFRLCRESHDGRIRLYANRYVRDEVEEVLRRKRPDAAPRFQKLIAWARVRIHSDPPPRLVKKYLHLINAEDAPILAGAVRGRADFLATLDRADFFSERLKTAKLPVIITTPQDFFQRHWLSH